MLAHRTESLSEIFGYASRPTDPLRKVDLFRSESPSRNRLHQTFRSQQNDEIDLPNIVIPSLGDDEDLYATVAAYYQTFSPISALSYVLSEETSGLVNRRPFATKREKTYRTICLGVAVGEAALAGIGAYESNPAPTYAACRRSLAFSLCRAQLIYGDGISADTVARRWVELRKLTGLSFSAHTSHAVLAATDHASLEPTSSDFAFLDPELSAQLRTLAQGRDNGELILATLARLYPNTKHLISAFEGPFNGRMSAFTKLVEALQSTPHGAHTDEIAVAFFCNLIQPGSFAHVGVLASLIEFYPAALVWYGFFCVANRSTGQQRIDSGLLTKLERDLLATFSFEDRPECDISLDELAVLSRLKLRPESIKPSYQRAILVGILPGVNVLSRFGLEGDTTSTDRSKFFQEQEQANWRVSRLLEEALHLLSRSNQRSEGGAKVSRPGGSRRKNS